MTETEPDFHLRQAAIDAVRELSRRFDDLVPKRELSEGFFVDGTRYPFADFNSGIFRPGGFEGPAALSVFTASPKPGRPAPYEDELGKSAGGIRYMFRTPGKDTQRARQMADADNRSLIAAFERQVQLIYFVGQMPGQYVPLAPVFVKSVNTTSGYVELEAGLPVADLAGPGANSGVDLRAYATREAKVRLHQQRFRTEVLRAYRNQCSVCQLKELALVQAAHILPDRHEMGQPVVENGISLCAIHHLAYDRNLMGIDPSGVVHISSRLLHEVDGPMLRSGIQAFHGLPIGQPRQSVERPDPERLDVRFSEFLAAGSQP